MRLAPPPSRCHLLDFLNELEANYHTNRDGLYALFDLTAEKGLDVIKGKSAHLRNGVFSPLPLKLMLFWHQNFIAAAEPLCQQWFSSFFKNLNFLVLAMPG